MSQYLSPVLEDLMVTFYNDAESFFSLVKNVVYGVSFGFLVVYAAVYLFMFIQFIGVLDDEIKQTRAIVNMIPPFVLEHNSRVRDQVRARQDVV